MLTGIDSPSTGRKSKGKSKGKSTGKSDLFAGEDGEGEGPGGEEGVGGLEGGGGEGEANPFPHECKDRCGAVLEACMVDHTLKAPARPSPHLATPATAVAWHWAARKPSLSTGRCMFAGVRGLREMCQGSWRFL